MSRYHLYVDSADESAVGRLLEARIVDGVTTNPTILRRSGLGPSDIPRLRAAWHAASAGRLFFQAWGSDVDSMLTHGRRLAVLGPEVTVKVPATRTGFIVGRALVEQGSSVLVTAVYSTGQAIAAAAIGAEFIAPYLGRLDDAGRDGVAEITSMHVALEGTGTSVLAASLRSPDAIVTLSRRGVRSFAAAPAVIWHLLQHDASDSSAQAFEADILS